ncbi:hypothetical protein ACWJKU_17205 [Methylocaldum sp. MU1018]
MAIGNGNTVFQMAYTPRDHLFEGGRRLARVLMIWWSLYVLVLFAGDAVFGFWDLEFSIKVALWLILAGVTGIRLVAASIGYVVRGFLGIRG